MMITRNRFRSDRIYEEEQYMKELIEEVKVAWVGILMCLNREQRLTLIVGELLDIDHNLATEIFKIIPTNFRKRLSRARKELYNWMNKRCSLVNKENSCVINHLFKETDDKREAVMSEILDNQNFQKYLI